MSTNFYGFQWISIDFYCFLLIFVNFYGVLWMPMDFYGFRWNSIDFFRFLYGFLWLESRGKPNGDLGPGQDQHRDLDRSPKGGAIAGDSCGSTAEVKYWQNWPSPPPWPSSLVWPIPSTPSQPLSLRKTRKQIFGRRKTKKITFLITENTRNKFSEYGK